MLRAIRSTHTERERERVGSMLCPMQPYNFRQLQPDPQSGVTNVSPSTAATLVARTPSSTMKRWKQSFLRLWRLEKISWSVCPRKAYWRGRNSTVNLFELTSLDFGSATFDSGRMQFYLQILDKPDIFSRDKHPSLLGPTVRKEEKRFIIMTQGANVIKRLVRNFRNFHNKLECLFLASLSSQVWCFLLRLGQGRLLAAPQILNLDAKSCQGQTL